MDSKSKDVKTKPTSTVLSKGLQPPPASSLTRIKTFAEGIQRIRNAFVSASSSPKGNLSPDDEALLFELYLSLIPRSATKSEIKCYTSLAGNLLADNIAGSVAGILNQLSAGTAKNQRIGSTVRLVRCVFRYRGVARSISQPFASQEGGTYRLLMVYDKMPLVADVLGEVIASGAATTGSQAVLVVAGNAGLTEGLPHPVNTHVRFEHLYDRNKNAEWQMIPAGTAGTNCTSVANIFQEADINLHGRRADFASTAGATPIYGSLNYFVIADSDQDAVMALNYEYICNTYYVDV